MNQGQGLTALAQELERQRAAKRDYLAPTRDLAFAPATSGTGISLAASAAMPEHGLTPWAHSQLAQYAGIPKPYYDRMLNEDPALCAANINSWLHRKNETRMLRTLDNNIRAILSRRYRPLDNYDLVESAIPILQEAGAKVESCQITETRLYLKAVTPRVSGEVSKGDICYPGVVISNSELGNGALKIEQMVYRLVCSNGMIAGATLRQYHLGSGADKADEVYELFSDPTRRLDDAALWAKVKDVTRAALSETSFRPTLNRLIQAKEKALVSDDVGKIVERTIQVLDLPQSTGKGILTNLAKGGDYTAFGLAQAVTATAETTDDYELATTLERAGGNIIELSPTDWRSIAEAA
jgi:hypothetical protein